MKTAHDLRDLANNAFTTNKYIETIVRKATEQAEMGSFSVNVTIPASITDTQVPEVSKTLNTELGFVSRQVSYKGYRMLHVSWR